MEAEFGLTLLLLVVVGVVTFMSIRDRKNKEHIAREIHRVGGVPIKISFQFVLYDRDNQHYNVQFADVLGRKHETRCMVNLWQGGLFWERTPAELISDAPFKAEPRDQRIADPASSREQLINDLVAENEHLREQLREG